ncbi:MAG: DUF5519 family protein [Actinomycetota bacterium]|nr:DUF5519 family protein [Actinomycetota bacterium]
MNSASAPATVLDEVATWPGVSTKITPRGATAIEFEGHEMGHVHLDRGTLDLPLPDDRRRQVLDAARAKAWYSNWGSKPLANAEDAKDGISLLRESYDELRANDLNLSRPGADEETSR